MEIPTKGYLIGGIGTDAVRMVSGLRNSFSFCEATSITPCFTVNIYETPKDMADMVEYLNGDITRSEDGKVLILHVVNTERGVINATLNLNDFDRPKPEAEVTTLSGDLTARNTPAKSVQYQSQTSKLLLADTEISYGFPAHSYTIVKFSR